MTFPDDYLKWRIYVAVFGPTALAFGTSYALGGTLLGTALALSFCLTIGAAFTRYMARTQYRADMRAELLRLQNEFSDVVEMVQALPDDQRVPYVEGLYRMEFRIRVLEEVLEAQR